MRPCAPAGGPPARTIWRYEPGADPRRADESAPARTRPALDVPHLRGAFDRPGLQRAVPRQPGEGPDGTVGRLRPADADRLRPRRRARPRRGRQGRRAGRPPGGHGDADGRDPARPDEHVDDDQRDRGVAAGPLHRRRRGAGRRRAGAAGHDPERHHQGVPRARDVRLPAGALDAAHRRHDRLHRRARAEVESDQHLLVPPAGGGGDAGAGDRLRDEQRRRRARRRPRPGPGRAHGRRVRADLVLRQRRRALHRGAREAARDVDPVGGARPRALRGRRRASAALPLRRAGQLARPHRGATGEQRAADRARGARRDARAQCARPRRPAARLERGARPAAPVGPAVVAAHPAGPRLRERRARVPRHLRGIEGHGRARRGPARRARAPRWPSSPSTAARSRRWPT